MKLNLLWLAIGLCLPTELLQAQPPPVGTAFTYQGQLLNNGSPASGAFDLSFTLYGGNQMGGPPVVTNLAVLVSNGLFTTAMDFGSNIFGGADYSVAIGVRSNGSTGAFASLSPQQHLTAVPYALYAPQAGLANVASVANSVSTTTVIQGQSLLVGTGNSFSGMLSGSGTIAGGSNNFANSSFGAILGGSGNQASGDHSVVAGGEGNIASGSHAMVGGGSYNTADGDYSSIGGGFGNDPGKYSHIGGGLGNVCQPKYSAICGGQTNLILGNSDYSFIGDGELNFIQDSTEATISGGTLNSIAFGASDSSVGGGYQNTVRNNGYASTIAGGLGNIIGAGASSAFIGGGSNNFVGGVEGTVPGGGGNAANGFAAFAAGEGAWATNDDSFVWSDGSNITSSFTNKQFMARASGGVVFLTSPYGSPSAYGGSGAGAALTPGATAWSTISDRNAKKNFAPVDGEAVLEKLGAVPVEQWNYKWESDEAVPNIGPMAQDFIHAFYPGRDDRMISTLEFDGVELAAIQGLNQKLREQAAQLKAKDTAIQSLEQRLERLERLISSSSTQR